MRHSPGPADGRSCGLPARMGLGAGGGVGAPSAGMPAAGRCRLRHRGPLRPGLCALQLLLMCVVAALPPLRIIPRVPGKASVRARPVALSLCLDVLLAPAQMRLHSRDGAVAPVLHDSKPEAGNIGNGPDPVVSAPSSRLVTMLAFVTRFLDADTEQNVLTLCFLA